MTATAGPNASRPKNTPASRVDQQLRPPDVSERRSRGRPPPLARPARPRRRSGTYRTGHTIPKASCGGAHTGTLEGEVAGPDVVALQQGADAAGGERQQQPRRQGEPLSASRSGRAPVPSLCRTSSPTRYARARWPHLVARGQGRARAAAVDRRAARPARPRRRRPRRRDRGLRGGSSTRSTSPRSPRARTVTRHDVKARIEEFNALAGHEHVHKGMTSRDLTENVEQLQVRRSSSWSATAASRARAARRPRRRAHRTVVTGRTHNVPAQATTLGKRFANAGEELLQATCRGSRTCSPATRCGAQGAGRHPAGHARPARRRRAVDELEDRVAATSASARRLDNVGQVYPRSLDLDVVAALVQVAPARRAWPPRSG
jgi:hypothetical protein